VGIVAVDFGVVAVKIPCALPDLCAGREIDTVMRVAIRPNDAWERSAGGRVVAHAFFDESLKIWQSECCGIGNDLGQRDVGGGRLILELPVDMRIGDGR
jgi:hypothetical protein